MKAYSNQTEDTYHVHLETKNTSFLKMSALLQDMGVKNWHFCLKLYDKGLKNVDPYDPDLTDEMRFRVFRECSENPWYFYREVFRVSENGAGTDIGGGSPFILNRGNMAYLWAMELNINTYLIMPRQTGKTWAAVADAVWTYQFNRGSTILHFNKNQKDANMNIGRIQAAIRMLPRYLQHSAPDVLDGMDLRRIKNNEKSIRNVIGSSIEAMSSASNESKADAMARGSTASKIWWDELAYIAYNNIIYSASTPAYEKAAELAIKNGAPHGISITTTPGDLATDHGAFAYKMMEDSIRFNEGFYDMDARTLNKNINNRPDKIPFIFVQYSYLQLGETEEWYATRYKTLNDPIRARREYLLEWINTNGNSPFDPDDVDLIGDLARQTERNVQVVRLNKYYDINVYNEYTGNKPVLIGVDVGSGLGRDSSAIVVIHPETLHPLAIFKSNMIELSKLRKLIMAIVQRMYPNCVLAIEDNSIGAGLISELRDSPIARVLYKEKKTRTIDQGVESVSKRKKMETIQWGYHTDPKTRSQMMETLMSIVHNSPAHLGYKELYDEVRFLELKDGRIDHSSATHDDVVMAYMGILWVVRYGKGLKGKGIFYTISDGDEDYEEVRYDTTATRLFADRLLRGDFDHADNDEETELLNYMLTEQHVQTSSDLAHRERMEYFKELDRIEGIDVDKDADIPDTTEALLLQGYNTLMKRDQSNSDPIAQMLRPLDVDEFGVPIVEEDWATQYAY